MRGDLPSLYSYLIADRPNPITFVVRKQKALHFSALQKNNPINFESGKLNSSPDYHYCTFSETQLPPPEYHEI